MAVAAKQGTAPLESTGVINDVVDKAASEMRRVIKHHLNPLVLRKPSTVTITVTMAPIDPATGQFQADVSAGSKLAPEQGNSRILYTRVDADGSVHGTEYDPKQLSLDSEF